MSMTLIKQLREKRAAAWKQATDLVDAAEREKRDLTAEEQETWRQHNEEIDGLAQREQTLVDAELREAEAAEAFRRLESKPAERRTDTTTSDELRAMLRGETREVVIKPDLSLRDLSKGTATAGGNTVRARRPAS